MIYQLVVALALVASASAKLFTSDPAQQKFMWDQFKSEHVRSYESFDEETHRFHLFLENLKLADYRNELELKHGGSATHGITKFSDLSQAEFEAHFLTSDMSMKTKATSVDTTVRSLNLAAGLTDWENVYTTPVKDQGYCGSCWAFSATEQIESEAIRELGATYLLSAAQVTQCTKASFGCGGGWTESAYNYVASNNIVQESDYPYTKSMYQGATGTCAVDTKQAVIGLKGFTNVNGETNMASYTQSTGPLSVCVDATTWNSYNGGIMSVCGKSVNHCVQAVGVDASSYWKVRNSWGQTWGESGHIRLKYGQDTCAITSDATYVTGVKKV